MRFQSLDQIVFRLPVPIGAIVRLTSKVLKTTLPTDEPNGEAKAHIMVKAEVQDVETGVSVAQLHGSSLSVLCHHPGSQLVLRELPFADSSGPPGDQHILLHDEEGRPQTDWALCGPRELP